MGLPVMKVSSPQSKSSVNLIKPEHRVNVILIWQSLVSSSYRSFWIHFAKSLKRGRLTAVSPHAFWELGGQSISCAPFPHQWQELIETHVLNVISPHVQMVWFHGLTAVFRSITQRNSKFERTSAPVLLAMMEPYSLSALLVFILAQLFLPQKTKIVFYSAQNIYKQFPLPLKLIQKFIFSRCNLILSLSEDVTAVLRRHGYQGKIIPFRLWADSDLFRIASETMPSMERLRLGYCGAVTESKGVLDLVSALEQLTSSELNQLHFEMAGGGPAFDAVQRRLVPLQSRGLSLKLHGALPSTAMPQFFNHIDVLIVPSRTEAHWKEQFGRVIVEAWACGTTVIGSNSGEIPILLSDPELIFEERNPHSLLSTLRSMILRHSPSPQIRHLNAARAKPYLDFHLAQQFAHELEEHFKETRESDPN